jgi:hypothetical protein
MFKNSNDKLNYLNRTGSHATKESATGRINAIPQWAQEPEQYYNSLRDQFIAIRDQRLDYQQKLTEIREKLKQTLPFKEFQALDAKREAIAAKYQTLEVEAGKYRSLARAAGEHSFANVFMHVAEQILDREMMIRIRKDAESLLGRPIFEVTAGQGEMSPESRASMQKQKVRQQRRQRLRDRMDRSVSHRLVWSDE